jgi:LysR family transcriptional regulator, glycine cleavage system transcriptional activator
MLNLPPLTELRAFEAAARHLSFKTAATELGVTPTAISHQIRLLEQHCGQPLFRRRPRPMALTAAGARLFPVIRDGLARFAIAVSSVRGDKRGPLRVTATNAFAGRWLVPRLPSWRKAHPGIALEVLGTDAVLDLGAGEADLAIRYARAPPPNLVAQHLFRDRFFAVCNPALLSKDRPICTPADLRNYPHIRRRERAPPARWRDCWRLGRQSPLRGHLEQRSCPSGLLACKLATSAFAGRHLAGDLSRRPRKQSGVISPTAWA